MAAETHYRDGAYDLRLPGGKRVAFGGNLDGTPTTLSNNY
jgi:hypothetical protein